jgi:hypothetical protein
MSGPQNFIAPVDTSLCSRSRSKRFVRGYKWSWLSISSHLGDFHIADAVSGFVRNYPRPSFCGSPREGLVPLPTHPPCLQFCEPPSFRLVMLSKESCTDIECSPFYTISEDATGCSIGWSTSKRGCSVPDVSNETASTFQDQSPSCGIITCILLSLNHCGLCRLANMQS